MIDMVTVGWLTLDDIVLTDHSCRPAVLGGGALYAAVGAQIWDAEVGIHSVTGRPFLEEVRAAITARGLDAAESKPSKAMACSFGFLHESDTYKQQIAKHGASSVDEMDSGRGSLPLAYSAARGFHIAPQTPAGSLDSLRKLSALPTRPVVTLDILSDDFIDRRLYADLGFLDSVTAFLPSEAELSRIWNPPDLDAWLRAETAGPWLPYGCQARRKGIADL